MIHLKFICDKDEVNYKNAIDLLANSFEIIVWMANNENKDGWSVSIKRNKDKKSYDIQTNTTTHKAYAPMDAINIAIKILLLWVH